MWLLQQQYKVPVIIIYLTTFFLCSGWNKQNTFINQEVGDSVEPNTSYFWARWQSIGEHHLVEIFSLFNFEINSKSPSTDELVTIKHKVLFTEKWLRQALTPGKDHLHVTWCTRLSLSRDYLPGCSKQTSHCYRIREQTVVVDEGHISCCDDATCNTQETEVSL